MLNVVQKLVFNLTNIATLKNIEGVFGKCSLESLRLEDSSLCVGWFRGDERGSFPGRTAVDSRCILGVLSVWVKQSGRKNNCLVVSCDRVNNVCYI
jgi:hypothetical protein